jgi:hypothetical protein
MTVSKASTKMIRMITAPRTPNRIDISPPFIAYYKT